MNLYNWWCNKTSNGIPWTYWWRWLWRNVEPVGQASWFFIGVCAYAIGGWIGVGIFWGIYFFGYIMGHFHWSKGWDKLPEPPEDWIK